MKSCAQTSRPEPLDTAPLSKLLQDGCIQVKLHSAKRARHDARANRAVMEDAFDAVGPDSVPHPAEEPLEGQVWVSRDPTGGLCELSAVQTRF